MLAVGRDLQKLPNVVSFTNSNGKGFNSPATENASLWRNSILRPSIGQYKQDIPAAPSLCSEQEAQCFSNCLSCPCAASRVPLQKVTK